MPPKKEEEKKKERRGRKGRLKIMMINLTPEKKKKKEKEKRERIKRPRNREKELLAASGKWLISARAKERDKDHGRKGAPTMSLQATNIRGVAGHSSIFFHG